MCVINIYVRERERDIFYLLANKEYFILTPSCGRGLRSSAMLCVISWLLVAYVFRNIRNYLSTYLSNNAEERRPLRATNSTGPNEE